MADEMSLDFARFPLQSKISLVEDHCTERRSQETRMP